MNEPTVDLGAQVAHLEQLVKQLEDANEARHHALMAQFLELYDLVGRRLELRGTVTWRGAVTIRPVVK